ncbi:hypothetical protein Ciccas_005243 [Cichlidogyrus casuarinus]|uniref:Uncharacterized protein n=1 Tax=Cichlidogyrus casuarinus TaxID=1844966 RepID=A0ABD2Q983_9PLAT
MSRLKKDLFLTDDSSSEDSDHQISAKEAPVRKSSPKMLKHDKSKSSKHNLPNQQKKKRDDTSTNDHQQKKNSGKALQSKPLPKVPKLPSVETPVEQKSISKRPPEQSLKAPPVNTPNIHRILQETSELLASRDRLISKEAISPSPSPTRDSPKKVASVPSVKLKQEFEWTSTNGYLKHSDSELDVALPSANYLYRIAPLSIDTRRKLEENIKESSASVAKLQSFFNGLKTPKNVSLTGLLLVPKEIQDSPPHEQKEADLLPCFEKVALRRLKKILQSTAKVEGAKVDNFRCLWIEAWQGVTLYISSTSTSSRMSNGVSGSELYTKYPMSLPAFVHYSENMLRSLK